MKEKRRLKWEQLTSPCQIENLDFESTADLSPLNGIIGQERGVEALAFGLRMKKKGYNIYIAGLSGTGRSSYSNSITEALAEEMDVPQDWVYVHNFKNPDRPRALSMEAGLGQQFKKDMEGFVQQLKEQIPSAFGGTDYETRRNEVLQKFQRRNHEIVEELNQTAKAHGFMFRESENGLITIPLLGDRPMKQEEYNELDAEQKEEIREKSNQLNLGTLGIFNKLKALEEELRHEMKKLDGELGHGVIGYSIHRLLQRYGHDPALVDYINQVEQDIVENINHFKRREGDAEKGAQLMLQMQRKDEEGFFVRYQVNLLVQRRDLKHAPIVNEANPTFNNLLGTIEYKNEMGILKTDFTQMKPGALHMANGGFLILNIKELLAQPFAWEALKRALKTEEINLESLNKTTGYVVTSTLKPEPIPLNIKVLLIGDANIYQALYALDEDFRKLFKIMADFDVEMKKNDENVLKMAQFIATHCEKEQLKHFDRQGVERVIEYSSRLADHQEKLSSRFNQIVEILYEADAWAETEGVKCVSKDHVEKAIWEKRYRNSKYEEKLNEMFLEGTLLMDVSGEKIGQINGLVVMGTGEISFGKPSRITVATYSGKSGIINIEREVKKSGSIHDKGVLILSGYLGQKYAKEKPLSLTASISFEQSYSMIDGDSASSTELYGILSSIAEVPIKQGIAVTGSINQNGEIQPIGGVNEKIEGFYDVCRQQGFTGNQGVIIPHQNVKNLMLKQEVLEAVKNNTFHIYAIKHAEEGIEILTGLAAGEKNEKGKYPEGTLNYLIMKKLNPVKKETQKEGAKSLTQVVGS